MGAQVRGERLCTPSPRQGAPLHPTYNLSRHKFKPLVSRVELVIHPHSSNVGKTSDAPIYYGQYSDTFERVCGSKGCTS